MPRSFNIDINKEILNAESIDNNKKLEEDSITKSMKTADDILEVLKQNKTTLEESYYILCSLADSIYTYATTEYDEDDL